MYILDTHTLLWLFDEYEHLSPCTRNIIQTEDSLYVSIATFWEIAIKQNIKKLKVSKAPSELMALAEQQAITILPIFSEHLDIIKDLPRIHNDPFDRLIIAQAKAADFTILTCDSIIPKYDVKTIW